MVAGSRAGFFSSGSGAGGLGMSFFLDGVLLATLSLVAGKGVGAPLSSEGLRSSSRVSSSSASSVSSSAF